MTRTSAAVLVAVVAGAHGLSMAQTSGVRDDAAARYALLAIEDARPATRADARPLLEAIAGADRLQAQRAVRALGRLEQADYLPDLRRVLGDADADVRAEAANALAQIAAGNPDAVRSALRARYEVETDPRVRAALCDALGRLPFRTADDRIPVEHLLARALAQELSPLPVRLGAARGLEALVRGARGTSFMASPTTVEVLRQAALGTARPRGTGDEDRVRRVAVIALNAAGAVGPVHERLAIDHDPQVRRAAVAGGLSPEAPPELRAALATRGLTDPHPQVRYEALRLYGRHGAADDCGPLVQALADPDPHVALLAVDLFATACPADAGATARLRSLAAQPTAGAAHTHERATWRMPARALVSLARRAPAGLSAVLPPAAVHPTWQVRVYAARAASSAGVADVLRTLAGDSHASVAAAAIEGLAQVKAHEADQLYRASLARLEYPVVRAAALALKGTPAPAPAVEVLIETLAALTAARRDTSRDTRLAVLERLGELGDDDSAAAVSPYLADADPLVARKAAEVLTAWTGRPHAPKTTRLQTLPLPPPADLAATPRGIRVTMADGRWFDVRFFVDEAPVAAWRISRLASQRYYDGLTWHRIVPNFIVQGGSPGADEFVGDGPFMRDELSRLSHVRGTVGLSTRGRDTGDAQIFINLVDVPRLDHEYTVIGEVVAGLDVVDSILEGDVMAKVEPIRPKAR